jgi:hypothetical protein
LSPDQDALADLVLARVQQKLAPLLPELMRDAVEEVLAEYLAQAEGPSQSKSE